MGIFKQRELGMFLIPAHSKEQLEKELNEMKSKHEQLNPNKEIILDVRPNPSGVNFDGNEAINFYVTVSSKLKENSRIHI
jgi:C-terminal processing protease CtpA/Prc